MVKKSQGGNDIDSLNIPNSLKSDKNSDLSKIATSKELNYHFPDGLRGFGAFAVYLHHFMNNYCNLQTIEDRDDGID